MLIGKMRGIVSSYSKLGRWSRDWVDRTFHLALQEGNIGSAELNPENTRYKRLYKVKGTSYCYSTTKNKNTHDSLRRGKVQSTTTTNCP